MPSDSIQSSMNQLTKKEFSQRSEHGFGHVVNCKKMLQKEIKVKLQIIGRQCWRIQTDN